AAARAKLLSPRRDAIGRARPRSRPAAAPAQGDAHAMSLTALRNGRVLLDEGFVEGQVVLVASGRIVDIVGEDHPRVHDATARVDLEGNLLLPGFIDSQVNG